MRRSVKIGTLIALAAAGLAVGGIVPEKAPIPAPGQAGAPSRPLDAAEQARFLRGRRLFDKDFLVGDGVGPQMNADSCRACHLDPVVGGAGGIDVQVQRPMMDDGSSPVETGGLAQTNCIPGLELEKIPEDVYLVEERNPPTILGLGQIQNISRAAIEANQDPGDADGDGIRGIAHILDGDVVGRLGWKAQVPNLSEFLRDAMGNEMGVTVPADPQSPFGFETDGDGVQDPELPAQDFADILFFVELLDFPPKRAPTAQTMQGEQLFETTGCADCHVPVLDGVEAYTNLLLHDVLPDGFEGVDQGMATSGLYRTPPLRGLRDTAPYFHDGRSETIDDAIRRHDGEARDVRDAYVGVLTDAQRAALLAFLRSL